MKTTKPKNQKLTVLAIPYYGQLVRHNGGLEHIYFTLMADPVTGEFSKAKLCVWNPKTLPSLPDWLEQQGIEALLCSDNRPGFEGLFAATGITIFWDQRGEVKDMVAQWTDAMAMESQWRRTAYA
ncbi:MAG TPA: hypothetical protein VGA63_13000 [Geopsychrobacteraceae bacterium]|jgi:hypothetical protein